VPLTSGKLRRLPSTRAKGVGNLHPKEAGDQRVMLPAETFVAALESSRVEDHPSIHRGSSLMGAEPSIRRARHPSPLWPNVTKLLHSGAVATCIVSFVDCDSVPHSVGFKLTACTRRPLSRWIFREHKWRADPKVRAPGRSPDVCNPHADPAEDRAMVGSKPEVTEGGSEEAAPTRGSRSSLIDLRCL
jgi:hypothetical protein